MNRLKPRNVNVPERVIQAEIYRQLSDRGIPVMLEARFSVPQGPGRHIRADVAVLDDEGFAIRLLEVKQHETGLVTDHEKQQRERQADRYDMVGLPWEWCIGWRGIESAVEWLATGEPQL